MLHFVKFINILLSITNRQSGCIASINVLILTYHELMNTAIDFREAVFG